SAALHLDQNRSVEPERNLRRLAIELELAFLPVGCAIEVGLDLFSVRPLRDLGNVQGRFLLIDYPGRSGDLCGVRIALRRVAPPGSGEIGFFNRQRRYGEQRGQRDYEPSALKHS